MVVRTLVKRRDRPRPVDRVCGQRSKVIWSSRPRCTPFGRRLLYAAGASLPWTTPKQLPPDTDETSGDVGITCLPLRACRRLRRFRGWNASRRPLSRQSAVPDNPIHRVWTTVWTVCAPTPEGLWNDRGHRRYFVRSTCGNLPQKFFLAGSRGRPPLLGLSRLPDFLGALA